MSETMEPTMQLRWRQPTAEEITGISGVHGRMPKILQQLWVGKTWSDEWASVPVDVNEWRDVPVVDDAQG